MAPASDDDPLIVIKLHPDELDESVRDVIAKAARDSKPVNLEIPSGEVDAGALKQITEWAVDLGAELRIRGEVG